MALNFDEGHKKVKLAMNEDLTYSNNPRYPIFENMAIQGNIHPAGDNNNILDFCCLFYHNKQPSSSKEDWVNTVGP